MILQDRLDAVRFAGLSEAESEDTQSTSTRVSRSQKMSKDVKYEIKVEKEVKSTRSGRRMCPYKSY